MKTRLACLATTAATFVLPALPAVAQAQSNITLYGVVDAGVEFLTHAPNTATGGSNNVVRMSAGNLSRRRAEPREEKGKEGGWRRMVRPDPGRA